MCEDLRGVWYSRSVCESTDVLVEEEKGVMRRGVAEREHLYKAAAGQEAVMTFAQGPKWPIAGCCYESDMHDSLSSSSPSSASCHSHLPV